MPNMVFHMSFGLERYEGISPPYIVKCVGQYPVYNRVEYCNSIDGIFLTCLSVDPLCQTKFTAFFFSEHFKRVFTLGLDVLNTN